jgi:hypothetical protein
MMNVLNAPAWMLNEWTAKHIMGWHTQVHGDNRLVRVMFNQSISRGGSDTYTKTIYRDWDPCSNGQDMSDLLEALRVKGIMLTIRATAAGYDVKSDYAETVIEESMQLAVTRSAVLAYRQYMRELRKPRP